jgi:dihydrofolate reductase
MLIYAMGVSADGFVADRDGNFDWGPLSEELSAVHTERVGSLGGYLLGRRLYTDMRVWETEPAMRATPAGAEFADIWTALPKVVFSRSLPEVHGNARIASAPLAEELAALASGGADVEIGGPGLAAQAIELDLVDEYRIFRYPVVAGGGTPYLPPVDRPLPLELVETRAFGPVVYERYRRLREPRN